MAIPSFMGLRGRNLVHAVNVVASSSYLLFGYDNGIMAGIITAPQFFATFGHMSADMQGTVTSLYEVGAFFGAMACLWIGEPLGRRRTCFLGAVIMIIGAVLQAAAYERICLIFGRVVGGIGLGLLTATTPPYMAECTTPAKRGRDIAVMLTNLIVGINLSYWITYGLSSVQNSLSWRIPLILQVIWDIIIIIFISFLPDSPRWLFNQGRHEDAMKSLQGLRNLPSNAPELLAERDDILTAIELEHQREKGAGWKDCFVDGGIRGNKRVLIAFTTLMFQNFSGTNALTYYSTVIFEQSVGLSRHLSLLMGGFLQVWFFVASLATWFLIDRFGRRQLFMFGYSGFGSCFFILMGMLILPRSNQAAGIVATVMIFGAQGFFTWGLMANTWCYPSEILPLALRTKGSAYAAAAQWLWGYVVVQVTPPGIEALGPYFYIIFAVLNFVMVICVYWFYPETSGLSLEAVDVIFTEDYTSWRGAVKKSLELRKEAKRTGNKRNDLEHMRLSHAGRDGELVEKDLDRDMLEHLENAAN